jgi:hypothetical protein
MSNEVKPIRIQRKRTKGYDMQAASPNGLPVRYVGRGTAFGNPFRLSVYAPEISLRRYEAYLTSEEPNPPDREHFAHHPMIMRHMIKNSLRGKNLACFCPLDSPCHADLLLRLAND